MKIIYAFAISFLYVTISILFSYIIRKYVTEFFVRKILHILMASWWFIRLCFLECRPLWLGPIFFMILLIFYRKKHTIKRGMEYFCFSLAIMTFLTELSSLFIIPATVAILTMGYADSAAALVGKLYQKYKNTYKQHSIAGSIAFFIVSMAVYFVYLNQTLNFIYIVLISALVAFVEAKILPKYDNITVPMLTFLMVQFGIYLN